MIKITALGSQGDGLTADPTQHKHVPFSLPGERVALRRTPPCTLKDVEICEASSDRVEPPCPHFGICGGCRLQHLSDPLYASFKRDKVIQALHRAGIFGPNVAPLVTLKENWRRRATLQFSHYNNKVDLGFYERGSHRLCSLETCLVLDPDLVSLLPFLKAFLKKVIPPSMEGSIAVLRSEAGIDVALKTKKPIVTELSFFEAVNDLVQEKNLARVLLNGEVVVERQVPYVTFNGVKVRVSASSFLQVNQEAETVMTTLIQGYLKSLLPQANAKIADLFSGRGLFAFALKDLASHVNAYEMDSGALKALEKSAMSLTQVTAFRRNLFSKPLVVEELNQFDAVVLDPPRDGAYAQSRHLAASTVPLISYISCKPETFARDAKILLDGGYCLDGVHPLDQFKWSHHVELVAFFKKSIKCQNVMSE